MSEEKMRILRMLEEGKITANEATDLLNSLKDGKDAYNSNNQYTDKSVQKEKNAKSFSRDIEKKIEVFSKDLEPKIQKATQTIIDKANYFADKISKSLSDSTSFSQPNEKERTLEIHVAKEDNAQLRLNGKNGIIYIKGYNGDKITTKIRYISKDDNHNIELIKVGNIFYLNYDDSAFSKVEVEAFVPEYLFNKIYLETNNKRVFVDGLRGDEINIITNNAPIELKNISMGYLKIETSKSKVLLENITGRSIQAENCNGPIEVKLCDVINVNLVSSNADISIDSSIRELNESNRYEWNVETSNASIIVNTLKGFNVGYEFSALTSLNGIQMSIPNIDFIENEKNYIKGFTNNFSTALKKLKINLETSNAPIILK